MNLAAFALRAPSSWPSMIAPLLIAIMTALAACAPAPTVSDSRPVVQAPPIVVPPQPVIAAPIVEAPPPVRPLPPLAAPRLPSRVEGAIRAAILLPLSGRDAAVGRALLEAAEMAVFDFGDARFVLIPQDTETAGAAVAAERALNEGARVILGPLFARQVPEVAGVARARRVPVISFSSDATVAQPGVYVMGIPPQQPIARAIGYAKAQGLTKFAALLPADALGERVGEGVRAAVQAESATLVRLDTYSATAVDISAEVRTLAQEAGTALGAGARRGAAAQAAAAAAARRTLGIEALVMAESGPRLRNLAPQLPFFDFDTDRIRLIGTPAWEDPSLGREPSLANAWFAAPDPAARVEFERRYQEAFGRAPPRVATIAYDAVGVAAVLGRADPNPDFSADSLTQPAGFVGADGLFRLRADGSVERGLAVLQLVPRGGLRVISPAPTSFEKPGS